MDLRAPLVALGLAAVTAPAVAPAFCGFYVSGSREGLVNKATRAVLLRVGTRTVLSMSNDYDGPPEDFAMVVPVPVVLSRDTVRTLPHDVFERVDALTAPRLVEYWEQNPCPEQRRGAYDMLDSVQSVPGVATQQIARRTRSDAEYRVRVEARFAVGEYDVAVLSAGESSGLESWLRDHDYNIPRGASAALDAYVRGEWKFFVARVDISRAQRRPSGGVRLSPLRMHYDASEFRLPVRLGLLNAPQGPQDLLVYVLHPSARFEVANYRNAFIPTNLDVVESARDRFAGLYGALFDATLESVGRRAVITEYAWSTGGCDPCPSPPLSTTDLATLGADVVPDFDGRSMVVTRLHTRYNAATLTDDLVFREAFPVRGGHEPAWRPSGEPVEVDIGARAASDGNSFQARYVVRHPWTGPITCEHPRRGVWGGPPSGGQGLVVARELAEARREEAPLSTLVRTRVPQVNLDARLSLPSDPVGAPPPAVVPATPVRRGCACGASRPSSPAPLALAVVVAALARVARRYRPRRRPTVTSTTASRGHQSTATSRP